MANVNPPVKGQAFTLSAFLYTTAGALITNPGTLTDKISKDYGDWGDPSGAGASEEDSTYGQIKIALDATDMNADVIDVYLVDNTSGCVPFTATIYTCSATRGLAGTALPDAAADAAGGLPISDAGGLDLDAQIGTDIDAILEDTGTTLDTLIKDVPTVAEFEARTLAATDYVVTTDTIAGVTAVTNGVTLADDAITSAKFDESTAYPLKSADTGSTAVARTGADSDTLETLSDEIDAVKGATFNGATDSLEALRDRGDSAWLTATGFSTHSAADVVTALDDGATLTTCATATGFSTHSAADVVTALGDGATLTACVTATGFSTHSAADVVTALGDGATLTACATATGFSTHSAADVVTALGDGATLTTCATATGFSTHSAADVWAVVTRTLTAFDFEVEIDEEALAADIIAAIEEQGIEIDEEAIAGAVVGLLGSLNVTVQSPVAEDGTITIYQGDDYVSAEATAITVTVAVSGCPDLTGAAVYLKLQEATWEATSVTSDGTDWSIVFEPEAADTAALTASQKYEVEAVLDSGSIRTLQTGKATLVRDIPTVGGSI